jgi:hypothetical protein
MAATGMCSAAIFQRRMTIVQSSDEARLGRASAHTSTVLIVCAGMVGVCLTAASLIRIVEKNGALRTLSRSVLAIDALVFLSGALVSLIASRAHVQGRPSPLLPVAEGAVLLGLLGVVVVCITLAFTIL